MKKRVLVVTPIHPAGMKLLEEHDQIELVFSKGVSPAAITAAATGVHAIIVRNGVISRGVIEAAPALEVVCRTGVGVDNVDIAALDERGIPLTITPGANATSVAEHAMYLLLALAKQSEMHHRAVIEGNFAIRFEMHARDIENKRLLIVGFGRVGSKVAPRAQAFGMQVHVYDPYVDSALIEAAGCALEKSLISAISQADVVSLHCPLTDETRNIFSTSAFDSMKSSAWLINTSRGGVVDESALLHALEAGDIAAAGLDVFAEEPPATDNRLLTLPNVVLSPHNAGVSLEAAQRSSIAVATNTIDALFGILDPNVVVNPKTLRKAK